MLVVYDPIAGSASQAVTNVNTVLADLNTIMKDSGVNATATLATPPIAIGYTGARDTASTFSAFQAMQLVQGYKTDLRLGSAALRSARLLSGGTRP